MLADRRLTESHSGWISIEITYGLYLSDHTILDAIDTELVVLSGELKIDHNKARNTQRIQTGIMIQNLKTETGWHLRGTRRVGVNHDDVEIIQQCVRQINRLQRVWQLTTYCTRSRRSPHSVGSS